MTAAGLRRRSGARSSRARIAYRAAATLLALALWQIAVVSGVVSAAAVAAPTGIVRAAGSLVASHAFGAALLETIANWALGLLVGINMVMGGAALVAIAEHARRVT